MLERVDSTNAEALRRAPERPTWFLALAQSAPKGSRGRRWSTLPGNLAASLALPMDDDAPSRLAFTAGLALHDALSALTGAPGRFALKWPNDVLMDGAKLAGILLEGDGRLIVAGFGVNLAAAPEGVPSAALAPLVRIGPEAFLDRLAPAFAARDAQRREGFEGVRRDWLDRAAGLGRPIVARTLRGSHAGVFEAIDDLGCLVLATPEGRRRIPSADVFFEGAA